MKILVIGGTGTVGSLVVQELLGRGVDVSVLTRSEEKAKTLPAKVKGVVGDLLEPTAVRSAFNGADGVFMLNPVAPTEAHEGLFGVNGMRLAGVKRVVYMSVHDVDKAPHLPHFGAKIPIEIAIKASGIPYTLLRPNNFYQNDYWEKMGLEQYGVYSQPIGDVGISRVDARDIAEVAAIALTTSGHEGQTYNLVGPDVMTGAKTAEIWGRALGKTVNYAGNDVDKWEQQASQWLPGWMAFDFRMMFAFFQEKGLKATPADIDRLTKVLGHAPRSFEAFASETAAAWKAA